MANKSSQVERTKTRTQPPRAMQFSVVVVNAPSVLIMAHSYQTGTLRVITRPLLKNDCCEGIDYYGVPRELYTKIVESVEDCAQDVEDSYLKEIGSTTARGDRLPRFGYKYLSNPATEKFLVECLLASEFTYLQVESK